ncbi:MAG TPA: 3-oxoacyl-[acyl-carrier-protein] synthase III C-terminal domain-containing protein [Kofleriaceae bacterium]|jgi:3-oxoacyl-[acyl-carrier-protein] synthase III|nr:3-oxoacyl-[acyl-carrier-protein] synthase III C-terminal domain-containing protein [Kofleriaceae bacterium]
MSRLGVAPRQPRDRVTEIVATGFAYPSLVVDNDGFFARCRFPITADRAALIADTRMVRRTWCGPRENTWTMARDAVRQALAGDAVRGDEIDLVVVSSCSTIPMVNYPDPNNPVVADLAPLVLAELGRDDAIGIDIKASYCAGFMRGLELIDAMLDNPDYRSALLIATDEGGRFATAESNRSTFCFLVGDAAGAVVLRKRPMGPRVGVVDTLGATAVRHAALTGWGRDGRSLFVRSARASEIGLALMLDAGHRLLARNRLTPRDIDWLLPAQVHAGTVEALCDGLEIPRAKLVWSGDVTGYAASASIPATLGARLADHTLHKGDLVLSLAAGGGMNVAGAVYYC